MSQDTVKNRFLVSGWAKIILCVWMGAIVLFYAIVFWPPSLSGLAQGLGISEWLQKLQAWVAPFFTAGYLS